MSKYTGFDLAILKISRDQLTEDMQDFHEVGRPSSLDPGSVEVPKGVLEGKDRRWVHSTTLVI